MTLGTPKPFWKYRGWRRNNSELGVKGRNWHGVEAKLRPDYPPLVMVQASPLAKHPGEIHYQKLWK